MFDRRGFLKFVGGAGLGILATPLVWKSIDDISIWSQNWPWIPVPEGGESTHVPTISKFCPSGQGIRVRLLNNRPVTVHGDPEHPLSQGGLNALAAAEVQLLHSPARLRQPQKRNANGQHEPISWDEAYTLLSEGLKKNQSKGIYALTGDPTSATIEILSAITNRNSGQCFILPGEEQPARVAWKIMCGAAASASPDTDLGRLGYDMEHSDMVLAIGAGVLESWGPVVRNRKAWSAGRPTGKEPTVRLAYAGPVQDSTAVGADWWLPMRAGQELALALGVAHLLLRAGRSLDLPDAAAFASLVQDCTPAKVAEASGVPAALLEEVAQALLKAKKPLVIVGSPLNQGGGAAPIMAGIACNLLLDNLNKAGGLRILPHAPAVLPAASSLDKLLDNDFMAYAAKGEAPGVFIFHEANPVYALPGGIRSIFEKAGFTVAFTSFRDETAAQCDLILPAAMGLERYDDAETPYGVGRLIYSLAVPVDAPQYEARSAGDVLLAVARGLGYLNGNVKEMPDLLKARAERLHADWTALTNGVPHVSSDVVMPDRLTFGAAALTEAARALQTAEGITLAPVVRHGVGTAQTGIPPYAVKLVGPTEVRKHMSIAHMNSASAKQLGLSEGDTVAITGPGGELRATVMMNEAVSTGSVSLLAGMGHTAFDAFSQNKGSNLLQLAAPSAEAGTGLTVWSAISVKVAKV